MASTELTPFQQAIDLLGPVLGILDSFNHRNKNQHRLSKWWAQFDMLRRGLRKLVVDLQACVDSQAKTASSGGSKNRKRAAAQKERDDALRKKMEVRAEHLHEQIVPRAFLAFTQLSADNQYAHLGLALVGVLAQVNAAITPLVPGLSDEADGDVLPLKQTKDAQEAPDLGVAISRSEIEQRVLTQAEQPNPKRAVEDLSAKSSETDGRETSLEEGKSTSRKVGGKAGKSKKSRDEFDSLFDSLETKKPSKKKKRKKGDEFDDLFSSLV
ncbi:hypothetical protein CONLIGDRAFT_198192 [Coniochaeta ligniaria NRRL 30616]|uniref:RNase MRP protein 1 RNA binding domain-containing protein n=1 Tax=Coniochaeta ligniaria NRRL 30616 TaxID=1408157 RepID=A0A1J7J315_9PEZI|nr:hypothetical protein CONLIGDRAFT_198192 [Coniochaeta ligniaria NRRL 30616]